MLNFFPLHEQYLVLIKELLCFLDTFPHVNTERLFIWMLLFVAVVSTLPLVSWISFLFHLNIAVSNWKWKPWFMIICG